MKQLIECVPNFSEGRNPQVIEKIAQSIRNTEGVQLLEIDPGFDANRTVMTFVGEPQQVVEAAFQAMKTAQELIDMAEQQGTHPRFGGTDVCPLVPLANISMEEVVGYARQLAKKVGQELGYAVYCYEFAAFHEERKNLAFVRKGEYEGLLEKLQKHPPDFGPVTFHPRSGATAIAARNFLIAYNINLNTKNVAIAKEIAREVRESGYWQLQENGEKKRIRGLLKAVKAIGWYIDEYNCAQVSMNLVDIETTAVHTVFDTVKDLAKAKGVEATGSELIGLIPLKVMKQAGQHYAGTATASEEKLINIAIEKLGLADLRPFNPQEKVIEYKMEYT